MRAGDDLEPLDDNCFTWKQVARHRTGTVHGQLRPINSTYCAPLKTQPAIRTRVSNDARQLAPRNCARSTADASYV